MFNPKHYNIKGKHFLWFTWFNGNQYALYWECALPIWWKPRKEIINGAVRFGWLFFAIGWSWAKPEFDKNRKRVEEGA